MGYVIIVIVIIVVLAIATSDSTDSIAENTAKRMRDIHIKEAKEREDLKKQNIK